MCTYFNNKCFLVCKICFLFDSCILNFTANIYSIMKGILTRCFLLIFISLIGLSKAFAILTPTVDSIPMKDGKMLAADIYKPVGMNSGPVILVQTPYNRQLYRFGLPLGIVQNINSSNYIIVVVDWRGFYGSKKAAYLGNPNIGEDGYSTVEWISGQVWSNGKIGTWGPSALGRVQFQTALKNPPHLTCICPLVAAPQYEYQEYFPNGALRTEYVEQLDQLGFGLSKTLMQHPLYDPTWSFIENANYYPDSIKVPCFMIGGWYDHTVQFMLPFFNAIRAHSPSNVRDKHRLLMGPWVHGGHGIAQVGTNVQGELTYPNSASWNDSLALLYFDYHLRTISNGWDASPFVKYYQMGENKWLESTTWPPSGIANVNFYLHKDGSMDNNTPVPTSDSLNFNYDPQDPSPTIGGPTLRSDLVQGPYDQVTKVESRNDLLVFSTAVLTKDVVLKGSITIHLKISSDKVDTDFDVRLTDVYPGGKSMLLSNGVMRMRFRNGNTSTQVALMVPGTIYDCDMTLPPTSVTFLAGHKIRLDVSSSNYPLYNRNMNTGAAMYPGNSLDSLASPVVAKNTVYTSSLHASFINVPLVGYTGHVNTGISNDNFHIYPNPANKQLNINVPNDSDESKELKIYNVMGQLVLTKQFFGSHYSIDISEFSTGVYAVQLVKLGEVWIERFVKQ